MDSVVTSEGHGPVCENLSSAFRRKVTVGGGCKKLCSIHWVKEDHILMPVISYTGMFEYFRKS